MITTYEQSFVNERITFGEVENFLIKHNLPSKFITPNIVEILSKKLNKSILELCFEIKPITVERLNAISIAKWKRWAEKYNIKLISQIYDCTHNTYCLELCKIMICEYMANEANDICAIFLTHSSLSDIAILSKKMLIDQFDYLAKTKAIHNLIWELETI